MAPTSSDRTGVVIARSAICGIESMKQTNAQMQYYRQAKFKDRITEGKLLTNHQEYLFPVFLILYYT